MSYTLFVAENCHQCAEIIKYLDNKSLDCRKVNVDKDDEKPPVIIFAFPALFENDELIGYGSDIINYFDKQQTA